MNYTHISLAGKSGGKEKSGERENRAAEKSHAAVGLYFLVFASTHSSFFQRRHQFSTFDYWLIFSAVSEKEAESSPLFGPPGIDILINSPDNQESTVTQLHHYQQALCSHLIDMTEFKTGTYLGEQFLQRRLQG